MFDLTRASSIIQISSDDDFNSMYFKREGVLLIGAGTHIYRKRNFFNTRTPLIIDLTQCDLKDYKGCSKSAEMFEIGGGENLYSLLDDYRDYIPEIIKKAVSNIPFNIAKAATIAGTLYPDGLFYDLKAACMACNCSLHIRRKSNNASKFKLIREKINIAEIYKKKIDEKIFIEKLSIPRLDKAQCFFQRSKVSVYEDPSSSVVLALLYQLAEDTFSNVSIVVCYADKGIRYMSDTIAEMPELSSNLLSSSTVDKFSAVFMKEIKDFFKEDKRNSIALNLFENAIEKMQVDLL